MSTTTVSLQQKSLGQRTRLWLRKYVAVFQVRIANNLAYLGEVVFRTLFLFVFICIFMQLWTVTYANKGLHTLDCFRISGIVWYLAITEAIPLSLPQLTRL